MIKVGMGNGGGMEINLNCLINKYKTPALILGHGPSLNNIKDELYKYKFHGFILFGCNQWFDIYNTPPDYWVMASNTDTMGKYKNIVNKHSITTTVLYADSVDLIDKTFYQEIINAPYFGFDQRHFKGQKCSVCDSYGCEKYLSNRLTIQEELQKYTKYKEHYGSGSSVALHMLSFAIIMGCNPIYITGVEINYHLGYASTINKNVNLLSQVCINDFDTYNFDIKQDFYTIKQSANNIGVQIYSLDKSCLPKIFEKRNIYV